MVRCWPLGTLALATNRRELTPRGAEEVRLRRTGILLGMGSLRLIITALVLLLFLRKRDRTEAHRIWCRVVQARDGHLEQFCPEMVDGLPELAKRYLRHSIQPGTPIAYTIVLEMDGTIRTGRDAPWLPMQARQILAPPDGFVWTARAGKGLVRFSATDSYSESKGRTSVWLLGILPVARASGPDISRSSRDRMAIESILNPAALLPQFGVRWETASERTVRATMMIDGESIPLTLSVEPDGRLRSTAMERWGNLTEDGHFARIPFGVNVTEECSFDGYTIPCRIEGGWWYGTDRSFGFIHTIIRSANYR